VPLGCDGPVRRRTGAQPSRSAQLPGEFSVLDRPNSQGGGKRTTRGHYDAPMRGCTIALDGNVVVRDGRIVDPAMIVPRVRR
jgi:2,5-dihydroxypyridine 5,6-dioxygenase